MSFNAITNSAPLRVGLAQVNSEVNWAQTQANVGIRPVGIGRWFQGRSRRSIASSYPMSHSQDFDKLSRSRLSTHERSAKASSLQFKQKITSTLTARDSGNSLRRGRFADNYQLTTATLDQRVAINLDSADFDAYLQIIDQNTGRIVAQNDDVSLVDNAASVTFTAKAATTYLVRVTSFKTAETGKYTLTTVPNPFNRDFGYGLPNAAAAVSGAIGQSTFRAVRNTSQWNLDLINAPEVWAQGFTGQNVVVAVLDTGIDYTHPDLVDNLWVNSDEIANNGIDDDKNGYVDDRQGWNFYKDGVANDPMDIDSHGTHVAGVIAAGNNGFGITGVAPSATIMPVRVTREFSNDTAAEADARLAAGIRYAVQNGAKVLNISLGNYPDEPLMTETRAALRSARSAGVVAVMAAGNERGFPYYATDPIEPARFSRNNLGIAVGAVNRNRVVADFSNPAGNRRSDFFVAPGVTVRSTVPGAYYEASGWSGTSMSTPHLTGIVALMLSAKSSLTPDQIEHLLMATADSTGITIG